MFYRSGRGLNSNPSGNTVGLVKRAVRRDDAQTNGSTAGQHMMNGLGEDWEDGQEAKGDREQVSERTGATDEYLGHRPGSG